MIRVSGLLLLSARRGRAGEPPKAVESMVKCSSCGVFLPRPDARITASGIRCNDPKCNAAPKG